MESKTSLTRREFLRTGAAGAAAAAVLASGAQSTAAQTQIPKVDIHAHMPLTKFGGPLAPRLGVGDSDLAQAIRSDSFDEIASLRIADMDRLGVVKTAVMPIDFGFGSDNDTHWPETEAVAAICRKHSDRFIPFFACDPRRRDAIPLLERAVNDLGMRGVKIHPLAGFAIDDKDVCYAFYKRCAELNVPVLGHCRPVGLGERDKLSRPERYGRVAGDFPELRICLGHLGGGDWTEDALDVVEQYPKAYGDLSTMQSLAVKDTDTFRGYIERAMNGRAQDRVMYGSDWPTGRDSDESFLAVLRETLDTEDAERILHRNAEAFLG